MASAKELIEQHICGNLKEFMPGRKLQALADDFDGWMIGASFTEPTFGFKDRDDGRAFENAAADVGWASQRGLLRQGSDYVITLQKLTGF